MSTHSSENGEMMMSQQSSPDSKDHPRRWNGCLVRSSQYTATCRNELADPVYRAKRKGPVSDFAMTSPPRFPAAETAAERRRKAILAAMSPNTRLSPSASSYPSNHITQTLPTIPSAQKPLPTQELPSVPSTSLHPVLDSRKRQLPWDEDIT